jgi:hypothetical protein
MWGKSFIRYQVNLSALLLALTTMLGCVEDVRSEKNRAILEHPEIEEIIRKYLDWEVADKSFGGKPKQYAFCAYKVLGVEQKRGKDITAYLWTFCKGKYLNENVPEYVSARPVSISIVKNQNIYKILDIKIVEIPIPGFSPTIQEIFPPSI